mmetsp:Transcript_20195/g.41244  ORF Transcript_20195/g.41244 Transcript_20195/m.41244 type:complete len:225 (+) Transcript_20195:404-1078(+)
MYSAYDSPMCRCIWPKEWSFFPKAARSAAYVFIACRLRRAMPTLIAASTTRSISRLRIMQSVAPPSAPTKLAAGTSTSSRTSSAVGDARMPHLSLSRCPREKPGMPRSTTKRETASDGLTSGPPVRAYMRNTSPVSVSFTAPLVIHILVPFSLKPPSGCARAVVLIASTSVPQLGSLIPIPPMCSPEHARGSHRRNCAAVPFRARLFTNSWECARYDRQKAGSE